ncbi:hypothetical protein HXY33_04095 [Candidatus Bathyarchaeota archaeon]|nr:hypothetical protein [Candidatus Bathyarchaeota archaeon]
MMSLRVKNGLQYGESRFPKLVAMIGGLLILIGIVLIGMAALAILGLFDVGFFDVGMLLERKNLLTFALAMVATGLLDTCAAVIIARW